MIAWVWVPVTLAASVFQVGRNALQRGMMPATGPWGATLVRFLFGLPFSALFVALTVWLGPQVHPVFGQVFWISAALGAAAQVLATAAMLTAMSHAGFAVGTALQQSSLPLAAIVGLLVFHDQLGTLSWVGVAITTAGLLALTWPGGDATGPKPISGAVYGLISGLCFGFSINAFRRSSLSLEPHAHLFSAVASVLIVQAMQAAVLTAILAFARPQALVAMARGWRESLGAGLFGALASSCWFLAATLAPAAPVRAVGVAEAPIAALAGRRLFRERLGLRQWLAGGAVLAGVVMTSLF